MHTAGLRVEEKDRVSGHNGNKESSTDCEIHKNMSCMYRATRHYQEEKMVRKAPGSRKPLADTEMGDSLHGTRVSRVKFSLSNMYGARVALVALADVLTSFD